LKSYTDYSKTYTYVDFQGGRGKDEEEGFQNFSVKNNKNKIIKYFLSRWDVLVLSQ